MPARRLLAVAALGVAAVAAGVPLSGAVLDTGSVSSGSLGASPDWTPPTVVVTGSTGTVSGTTTVTATASDVTSSVRSVTIQVRAAGTTSWTTLCTATTSPYTCTWTTTAIPDGTYDVRAVAVDAYDNTATSATAQRVVDNTAPTVSIDEAAMPDYLRGTVTIPATATDAGSGIATVRIERSGNGTSWTALCTDATSPYSCGYTTSGGGDLYLRAVATDNVGQTTTSAVVIATIDNVAPTVTTTYPGSQLAGTVSLTATASDTDSGIASVLVEQRASSTSPWVAVCTATASPYTCRWDTTAVANGTTYAFRSTATDLAGNSSVSAVTSTSTVDNRVASVSLEDPGQYLRGSVTLLANANAPGGVASVAIQYAPTGTTGWATVCTTTTSPYTCTWDTTKIANGTYDLRAVMTPVSGSALASATVSARVVDNSLLRGLDVQATNGGTAGRVDEGDTLQLTYSGPVSASSLVTGWDGSARSVGIRLRDGSQAGGLGGEDVLDVFTSTGLTTAVRIGTVNTKGNYVKGQAMVWTGTMTAQTVTVNGTQVTRVTLQLGALTTNDTSRATKTSRTMTWTPSSGATSPSGQACSTAPVDETGALDRDF
jgi:hypothetical protein